MTSTFYPPYHVGGDATHLQFLAEALTNKGHEVHVIYNKNAYKIKKRGLPQKTDYKNVNVHEINSKFNYSPYWVHVFGNSNKTFNKFEKTLKETKPDVVHHHNISLLGYHLLKKKGSYKNFYTAHDYWLICQRNDLFKNGNLCNKKNCFSCSIRSKRPFQLWRSFNGFKNAVNDIDVLIAPSTYMKETLKNELDLNIKTIHNFVPNPPSTILDPDYSNYFLYVGSLEKHKGVMDILKVFIRYQDEINAKLLMVGTGSLENTIKKVVKSHNLENKIIQIGWKDHSSIYPYYKNALALLIPSIWPENAPLVTLEAFSVGTPVIGSMTGGIPEIIGNLDENLIFQPSEVEEIKNLIVNYDREKYPKEKVKKIFKSKYSIDEYLKQYKKIL